ncbi:hypothetical protein M1293_02975 [Candidatus Parvarchaeota archaeon]|nr:hypothetical protein [Candidatus Parvarchaeota archaeon]
MIKAKERQELLKTLINNNKRKLEEILYRLEDEETRAEIISHKDDLDYTSALIAYGVPGIRRFYDSLIPHENINRFFVEAEQAGKGAYKAKDLDGVVEYVNKGKVFGSKKWWLLYPAKLFSETYDLILRKTGNHVASYAVSLAVAYDSLQVGVLLAASSIYTLQTGYPFMYVFETTADNFIAPLLIATLSIVASSTLTTLGLVSIEREKFKGKGISEQEIEKDIRMYSNDFSKIWDKYSNNFFSREVEPSLRLVKSVYMMASSEESCKMYMDPDKLREHDMKILPAISRTLERKLTTKSIIHACPAGVGGVTLIFPSAILGKISRKHAYGPIFVNPSRSIAAPSYDFAVAHEFAHASGFLSEPAANYFALKSMGRLDDEFPLQGYDIYGVSNRLAFAVAALAERLSDRDRTAERLAGLSVPKFIIEALYDEFNPDISPLPPLSDNFTKGLEREFSSLYTAKSYYAIKKFERSL